MPSLKEYKAKLASLKNTQKMTKTMKMVSASKLYKTMDAQRKATVMAEQIKKMVSNLAASIDQAANPLLKKSDNPKRILILLITSDKGLCAGFNNNLIKFVSRWMESPKHNSLEIVLATCGRRGNAFFRSRTKVYKNFEGVTNKPEYYHAEDISEEFQKSFLAGRFDEVHLAYNHFINPISQQPQMEKILPIESDDIDESAEGIQSNYLLEPSREVLLSRLLPMTVTFKIYYALLENTAGENGARMTAMDAATTNASKMIDQYTLLRNRARQAAITKELIEIISGSEALNS